MRKYGPIDWLKAAAVTALLSNAVIGATLLTCGSCAPVDMSHIEVFQDEYGQLTLSHNLRTGEFRVQAVVSVPAVCEGDSTHLDLSYEIGGVPETEDIDGQTVYNLHEMTETYMKAAAFAFLDDGTVLVKTGACLAVPCHPNCVQGVFVLRKVVVE